ncbi:MAG: MoxR family ATPase [Clostridiaceae bacterium]|nr:MoxR family ATPase [Clostridiaceae bacterium]
MITEKDIYGFHDLVGKISKEIAKDMVGQKDVIDGVLIAMISGGNVLLEGVPGLGKTRLVRTIGRVFDLPFSRIQFTPDLMPADVVGTNIVVKDEMGNSVFKFQPGPIFSNIVLADEINRATPKTQSALLEAMQEHTVTVGGVSRKLDEPFFVLATQNPIEQEGTYPLPEAQMDRFMFKLLVKFPSPEELTNIVRMTQKKNDETAEKVATGQDILKLREVARGVPVADPVMDYAMRLITRTHPDLEEGAPSSKKYLRFGASPRGAQALISGAKVRALMNGRYNVSYEDIEVLSYPVLRHRIALNFEAMTEGLTSDMVIERIISETDRGV